MQAEKAHGIGVSTKSQLLDSLKVYLNNKKRLQPIIGLGSIVECVNTDTHNREALYLCLACVCRLCKDDMKSHIMGSLHRYKYIKAWHPHLVSEWEDNCDLTKLAWPLMEKAKVLEGKEGPGEVQLIELKDAFYKRMATLSESTAVAMINNLRDKLDHNTVESHRSVGFSQDQERQFHRWQWTSEDTNEPEFLEGSLLNDNSTSMVEYTGARPETSEQLEFNKSILHDYSGPVPLIGLPRVTECKNEEGYTHFFLCHCCCKRLHKKGIIDHMASTCHLKNYLKETDPQQMEFVMASNGNYNLLQSMAMKAEQRKGRGELQKVNAPRLLCERMTQKSYNFSMRILCHYWRKTDIQNMGISFKAPEHLKKSAKNLQSKSLKWKAKRQRQQRSWQTGSTFSSGQVSAAPQEYKMQPMTDHAMQAGQALTITYTYKSGTLTNPEAPQPQRTVSWSSQRSSF